jgi:D-lactate dehydrogenase
MALRGGCPVQAAELLDRTSIRAVENLPAAPPLLRELSDTACAVLMETRAADQETLRRNTGEILAALEGIEQVTPARFHHGRGRMRTAVGRPTRPFSAVSSYRAADEFVITRGHQHPGGAPGRGVRGLPAPLRPPRLRRGRHGARLPRQLPLHPAHAHQRPRELNRLHGFLDDLAEVITRDFDGSLKAEHGTGRAIAPYVRLEWGDTVYAVMREIKALVDPHGVLNPGVMFDEDRDAHLGGLKLP